MKTSPAFQFYPADFLSGTAHMSACEVGAYIRLLCHQWQQGYVPADLKQLARISGLSFTKLVSVISKFEPGSDGNLRNERLESVREKLLAYQMKQAGHGKKGGRPPTKKQKGSLQPPLNGEKGDESSQSHSQSLIEVVVGQDGKAPPRITRLHPHCTQLEAEEWAQIHNRSTADGVQITPEIAVSWWEDRTRSDWQIAKGDALIPLANEKQTETDLISYARKWATNRLTPKTTTTPKPNAKSPLFHSNGATGLANAAGRYDTHRPAVGKSTADTGQPHQVSGVPSAVSSHSG